MKITLDIPEYKNDGLQYHWEDGFEISVDHVNNQVLIKANKAGLVSLAAQLLTLAQEDVPAGYHFHYDERNSLEGNSKELVIEKI